MAADPFASVASADGALGANPTASMQMEEERKMEEDIRKYMHKMDFGVVEVLLMKRNMTRVPTKVSLNPPPPTI